VASCGNGNWAYKLGHGLTKEGEDEDILLGEQVSITIAHIDVNAFSE